MAIFDSESPFVLSLGSNSLGSAGSFQFRKHWKDNGFPVDLADINPMDFWYERLFYGRINKIGEIIYPSETNLKQIPVASKSDDTLWALDFVVDAFVELRNHIKDSEALGLIQPTGEIVNFNPSAGWVSANLDYNFYMERLYDHLVTYWFQKENRNKKIKNFGNFLTEFLELVDDASEIMPFTKSALILSKYFSPLSSGLMIEISSASHAVDIVKQKSWIEDPNFTFYRNAAKQYGFLIDKNAPWRLIADINSAPMSTYMKAYGVTGETLFDEYYYKSHQNDIESLKIYLVEMYNAYVEAFPQVNETRVRRAGGKTLRTISRLVDRFPTSLERVNVEYPPEFWLKTYYYIRLREMRVEIDNVAFNRQVEKIYKAYKLLDFDKALDYINNKIRKLKVTGAVSTY